MRYLRVWLGFSSLLICALIVLKVGFLLVNMSPRDIILYTLLDVAAGGLLMTIIAILTFDFLPDRERSKLKQFLSKNSVDDLEHQYQKLVEGGVNSSNGSSSVAGSRR